MSEPLRIGPYAVERVLGRGGMGVVYAARDERLGRLVALKLLAAGFDDERAAARLRCEAEALGRLRHPGVVPVHDFFLWQGRPCLVLEFVPGGSLEARLRAEGGLPLGDALRVLSAVADAVAAAHASGLLHRDLKAANVLLRSDGRAVVTDFGLARELASARERLTRTGELLGTPGSMAPEQARGGEVDERTDVYGLGALLFEALTGRPPFVGKSPLAVLDQVVRAPAPAPSELRAGLPPAVDRLCARALAKSPEDRPQSAREFAAALRALAAGGEASPAARRRSLLVAAALLGCSGAVGVLALWDAPGRSEAALAPPSAGGEGPGGVGASAGPSPGADGGAAPGGGAAEKALGAALALCRRSPYAGVRALEEWLARWPALPSARRARRVLQRLGERPLFAVDLASDLERAAFAGEDTLLVSEEEDEERPGAYLRCFDLAEGRLRWEVGPCRELEPLAVSPDGRRALVGGKSVLYAVDVLLGKETGRCALPFGDSECLAVDWERNLVLAGGEFEGTPERGPVVLLDARDPRELRRFEAFVEEVRSVGFLPGGRGAVAADAKGLYQFSLDDSTPRRTLAKTSEERGYVRRLRWVGGRTPGLAVAYSTGKVVLLPYELGSDRWRPPVELDPVPVGAFGAGGGIEALVATRAGDRLYVAAKQSEFGLRAWFLPGRKPPPRVLPPLAPGGLLWVALSPSERRLAVVREGRVEVWQLPGESLEVRGR